MVILLHNNTNNKVVDILLSSNNNNNKVMTKLRDGIIEVTMEAIQEVLAALTGGNSLRATVYCKRA
jgi:response regulator of citrate/malate metabolism